MKKWLNTTVSIGVILLIWKLASAMLDRFFLPDPVSTLKKMVELLGNGTLRRHLLKSSYRLLAGTGLGLMAAVPMGICMGRKRIIDEIFGGIFRFLYPIPKVVFMPIIIVMMGIGDASKIFLITVALFFHITIIIRDSAAAIQKTEINTLRLLNATWLQTLYHVILPGCLPGILTALKTSIGTSVALLLITEVFASVSGIGYYIMNSMDARNYKEMYVGIIALALVSAIFYGCIEFLEKKFCKWNYWEAQV